MTTPPPSNSRQVILSGCAPTPLADYLKALGVFRLVSEQMDPHAAAYWHQDRFVLESVADEEALREFLLHRYRPTPILAPWNGGSGFYPKDATAKVQVERIESSHGERLHAYRDAIAVGRRALSSRELSSRPDGNDVKHSLLTELRAELNEEAVRWVDAAVLLGGEKPQYPPLLGTGGNDGRLEFTNNFMQRILDLIDPDSDKPLPTGLEMLDEALFSAPTPGVGSSAIGQFAPGDAGGTNQGSGVDGKARVNPWDYVLMLEGALLFASAITRRMGTTSPGALSYPFTVRATGTGAGGAAPGDEGQARAEIWVPLWDRSATLPELRALLSEGRATLGRRVPADGLDFSRAVSRLGVDRGIAGFQRFSFLMRSGKTYFATPLNRVSATRNREADLVDDLDRFGWLRSFRRVAREQGTRRAESLGRRLEEAIFALTLEREHPARRVQDLLMVLGEAQLYLADSSKARDRCPPVPWLSKEWLQVAEGETSPELSIAAALTGLHARKDWGSDGDGAWVLHFRSHLAPERHNRFLEWDEGARHGVTWGPGGVEDNLARTAQRRMLEFQRGDLQDRPWHSVRSAPLEYVLQWLYRRIDERRLERLLPGLALVRIPSGPHMDVERQTPLPAAYRMLKPFFSTDRALRKAEYLPDTETASLTTPPYLLRALASNRLDDRTLLAAVRRLRNDGIPVAPWEVSAAGMNGRRLLAALLVPLSDREFKHLLPPPEREGATTEEEFAS